jgi:hypothetical protein
MSFSHDITAPPTDQPVAESASERWLGEFARGWAARAGADAFIAHFRPMLAEDVILRGPWLGPTRGLGAFEKRFVRPLFALMPDLRGRIGRSAVRGETILAELTIEGTLRGGRQVHMRVCDRIELRDGLAFERETYLDPSPLLAALALSPRSWPQMARLFPLPMRRR